MDVLKMLLLEKRIDQISSNIDIVFNYDIIKTKHAEERKDFEKRGIDADTRGFITNKEMAEFVSYFRKEISEKIAYDEIVHDQAFVIRSEDREMSMAIVANHVEGNYWKLIIKTVFRETSESHLKVAEGQLVLEK